jgi:hypothetical protein
MGRRRVCEGAAVLCDENDSTGSYGTLVFQTRLAGRDICFLEVRLEMAQLKHKYVWVAQPSDRPQP